MDNHFTQTIGKHLDTILKSKNKIVNRENKIADLSINKSTIQDLGIIDVEILDKNYSIDQKVAEIKDEIAALKKNIVDAREALFDLLKPYAGRHLRVDYANETRSIVVTGDENKLYNETRNIKIVYNGGEI